MATIALEHVHKSFSGGGRPAVADLSMTVADGERLAIVGPSGSGKSTALRLIAGLETPTSGRVLIDGSDVTHVPPEARDLAMVFQSYALYPHMTVRSNLAFGLRMRGVGRAEIDARVLAAADALGLRPMLDRRPAALSGGERQRVALGRAIVRQPRAFLFDEPLSNLDPRLRGDTRAELVALHARLGATMIYVTHDQEEAMTLGQRIAVLREGVLEQLAPAVELYDAPANTFVARFIGSPPMNLLTGPHAAALAPTDVRERVIREGLTVGIRPHDVQLVPPGQTAVGGTVELVEPLGHASIVHLMVEAGGSTAPFVVVVAGKAGVRPGDPAGLAPGPGRLHLFSERRRV